MPAPNDPLPPPAQPLPLPLSAAQRGFTRDAAPMSVGDVDSHGGGIAIGPGATVHDQRRYEYHLPATPSSAPPFVVPYPRNPLFTGRDAELARLGAWLEAGQCVAVVGTGGLGKTQLAAEYADAARDHYPGGVFWLNMEQPEGIAGQVAALAGPGGLALPQAPALDFAGKVAAVRAAWSAPIARLLIFDNLEDPKVWREWRPRGGGARVLITSRRQTWTATSGVRPLVLPALPRAAARELLLAPRAAARATTPAALLADPATAADADAICEALGDLPLALALAGAYLEATPSATLARYRAVIEAAPLARLEMDLDEPLPTGHEASILKTFALSYDKLDITNPNDALARTILHRAAVLAPPPIPRRLLVRAAGLDPDDTYAQEQADHALRRLDTLGLIEDLGEEGVRLHRLVAGYARHRAPAPTEDSTAVEDALIDEVYAINEAGYPLAGVPYLPHLRQTIAIADPRGNQLAALLLNALGGLLKAQGDFARARPYYERALEIREQILGPTRLDTAVSVINLGSVLQDLGDLAGARPYYERALAIYEQIRGSDHPDTALCLNNLGSLLQVQGDLAGARPYFERALTIREQTLGPSHPDTADSIAWIGRLLEAQGDLEGARPYYERALAIHEQTLGTTHPHTANSLNILGRLLQEQGDLAGARPYLERALAIHEQTLGPLHPETAASLSSLGGLLYQQGDTTGALPLLERALTIYEQTLGPTHFRAAGCLAWLGYILQEAGDFTGARPYLERALAINEQTFGPSHPDTAICLNNLGQLLQAQGDLAEARSYLERALVIQEQTLGPTHRDTAVSFNNLGRLLREQGDLGGARPYLERALAIHEQTLGPLHPVTATSLSNLGVLLFEQGDSAGALPLLERALAIREQQLGPDHPETAKTRSRLEAVRQALEAAGGQHAVES